MSQWHGIKQFYGRSGGSNLKKYEFVEPKQAVYKYPDGTFEVVSLGNKTDTLTHFEMVCYLCANDTFSIEEVKANICRYYKYTDEPIDVIQQVINLLIEKGLIVQTIPKKELHKHAAFNHNLLRQLDSPVNKRTILSIADIEISITELCPFNCTYCSKKENESTKQYVALDRWKQIIEEAYSIGANSIKLSGGEPLHPKAIDDTFELVRHAKEVGYQRIVILTSGFNLAENIQRVVESGVTEISISYNMISHYEEDRIRNQYVEKHIKEISRLLEYDIQLDLCCVVTQESLPLVEKVLNFALENKFGCAHFYPIMPVGGAKSYWDTLKLSSEDLRQLMLRLEDKREALKDTINISAEQMYLHRNKVTNLGCEAVGYWIYFSEDGCVSTCACGELATDNIKGDGMVSIWRNSEYFESIRNFKDNSACTRCADRKYCVNNCYIRLTQATTQSLTYACPTCELLTSDNQREKRKEKKYEQ